MRDQVKNIFCCIISLFLSIKLFLLLIVICKLRLSFYSINHFLCFPPTMAWSDCAEDLNSHTKTFDRCCHTVNRNNNGSWCNFMYCYFSHLVTLGQTERSRKVRKRRVINSSTNKTTRQGVQRVTSEFRLYRHPHREFNDAKEMERPSWLPSVGSDQC